MKLRNYLLAGIALLGFAACTSDDNCPTGPVNPTPEGGSFFSIAFETPKLAGTRGNELEDTKVSSATIYLSQIEGDNIIIKDIIKDNLTISEDETNKNIHYINGHTTLERGAYFVTIIANEKESQEISNLKVGANFLGTEAFNIDNLEKLHTKGGFLMMSSNKLKIYNGNKTFDPKKAIYNQAKNNSGDSFIELAENKQDNPAEVKVYLDRYVAKIDATVQGTKDKDIIDIINIQNKDGLKFKLTGFITLNIPKAGYIIEQWNDNDDPTYILSLNKDNKWSNQLGEYVKINNGEVTDWQDNVSKEIFTSGTKYIIENNVTKFNDNKPTNAQGYTTGVILKVSAGETFYAIQDGVKWTFTKTKPESGTYYTYEDGVMYYTYFIPDLFKNEEIGTNTDRTGLYYTTMRNTWYKLNFKTITFPGGNLPGGDLPEPQNPDRPIDPNKYSVFNIEVFVNDWIEGDLNIEM